MNQPIFTYNEEQAVKAGQSNYISETGAYIGKITLCKWITTPGGAKALEIAFEDINGLKSDYLNIYYQAKNGDDITSGHNMIHAILGCAGVKSITPQVIGDKTIAPELTDKRIGLMLQKVLRLKQDGNETYNFQIICPFSPVSRKTVLEHRENRPAEWIDHLVKTTQDKDDRKKQNNFSQDYAAQNQFYGQSQQYQSNNQQPWDGLSDEERNSISPQSQAKPAPQAQPATDNFDDDIPF